MSATKGDFPLHPCLSHSATQPLLKCLILDAVDAMDEMDVGQLPGSQIIGAAIHEILPKARCLDLVLRFLTWLWSALGINPDIKPGPRPTVAVAQQVLFSRVFHPHHPGELAKHLLNGSAYLVTNDGALL